MATRNRWLLAAALAFAGAAPVQAQSAGPACPSNNVAQVRISQLVPGGTFDGFGKAVAAHAKWYADHGYTSDKFAWGRVVTMDQKTRTLVASPDMIQTFHFHTTPVPRDKQDAGWAAYVAIYQANSKIVSTTLVCMAK